MTNIITELGTNIMTKLADLPVVDPVGGGEDNLPQIMNNIITAIIAILGFVCVVVMIIGGVNYMISAGDSSKVTKAKNTILYGLIGLVICVLAFAIVNFVINNIIANAGA